MRALGLARSRAFTLIELLVVILIVAILIAVALPSFLGQTGKAQDSAVTQQLSVVRVEARAIWTSAGQGAYPALGSDVSTPGSVLAQLHASEPADSFISGGTSTDGSGSGAAVGVIDVTEPTPTALTACEQSQSGTVFCLAAQQGGTLTAPTAYRSSGSGSFGASNAQAAGVSDVIYSTGTTEAAARCVLTAALKAEPLATACASYPAAYSTSWADPVTGSATTVTVATPPSPPALTTQAAITPASPTEGSAETVSVAFSGASSETVQWYDCASATVSNPAGQCSAITGATSATYTAQPSDNGAYLTALVTATNAGGSTHSFSTPALSTPNEAYYENLIENPSGPGYVAPTGYWPLQDTSGATATDAISSAYNGTYQTGAGTVNLKAAALFGTAMGLTGNGGYMSAPNGTVTNPTSGFTVETWFEANSLAANPNTAGYLMFKQNPNTSIGCFEEYALYAGSAGRVGFVMTYGASCSDQNAIYSANGSVSTGTWNMAAATWDGSTMKLYLNGRLVASSPWAHPLYASNGTMNLGRANATGSSFDGMLNGAMSNAAIYSQALSSAQIAAQYQAG